MTTQTEKVRKLRALARSPNKHEAALALAKAQALESKTAKAIAYAIEQLLKERELTVRVRRHSGEWRPKLEGRCRRALFLQSKSILKTSIRNPSY
jgi:hypothetical protein